MAPSVSSCSSRCRAARTTKATASASRRGDDRSLEAKSEVVLWRNRFTDYESARLGMERMFIATEEQNQFRCHRAICDNLTNGTLERHNRTRKRTSTSFSSHRLFSLVVGSTTALSRSLASRCRRDPDLRSRYFFAATFVHVICTSMQKDLVYANVCYTLRIEYQMMECSLACLLACLLTWSVSQSLCLGGR